MEYWLDVDTGIDDAIALLAASRLLPGGTFRWVSTVAGNVTLENVLDNTRRVLAQAGRDDVPVFRGADRPLVRERVDAAYVHGDSGLGSVRLPPPTRPTEGDLTDLLRRLREVEDGSLCLVATGPLTNIALLARTSPDLFARKVVRTVWMGGGKGLGNITPAAEFNAFADPEAASVALKVLSPVTVVHLGTTHSAYLEARDTEDFAGRGRLGRLARALLTDPAYSGTSTRERIIVHDAVALLEAVFPGALFETSRERLEVDLSGGPGYGATLLARHATAPEVDWSGPPDRKRFVERLGLALTESADGVGEA